MMRRISISLLVSAALLLSASARAEFSIPGYELVQTAPVETSLHSDDLRSAAQVWTEMFDNAKSEIVIGQFYAVVKPGSVFEKVVERLEAAGKRV
jgi:hypothetical protein